jgi:misacylated tRNA(Ala) deacylase
MHTAQHIVSKVVLDEYDATTAGNQVHEDRSRIDFEPAEFSDEDLEEIEEMANEIVDADIELQKSEVPRDRLEEETEEGRTNLDLIPDHIDPLRAVEIGDIDICPCGGTHVDSTGELGELEIVERRSKGADVERIEFVLND